MFEQSNQFDKEVLEHKVFTLLKELLEFYDSFSTHIFGWVRGGLRIVPNLDSHFYLSIAGTLESINDILLKGRFNDAYALLRKYDDSTTINTYVTLYMDANWKSELGIVEKIDNWITGKEQIPTYKVLANYIRNSSRLDPAFKEFYSNTKFDKIRSRCNDNMHYNYFKNLFLNKYQVDKAFVIKLLNQFYSDLSNLFARHISFIFFLNDHFMMSSDYQDYLEANLEPPEGSMYWAADFIQLIINDYITPEYPDITDIIKQNTTIKLS